MTWLLTLATGVLTAVLAAISVGILADRWTVWFRISSFEGGSGIFVVMSGILGGIAGLVLGIICSRCVVEGADAHFGRGLGLSAAWVAGLVGLLAVGTYLVADHPPRLEGKPLDLLVEIRTPVEHDLVSKSDHRPMVSLANGAGRTVSYRVAGEGAAQKDKDRWLIPVRLSLSSSSPNRVLSVRWDDHLTLSFPMPLRSKPARGDFEWSDWLEAGSSSRNEGWAAAGVDADFRVRYRVDFELPPPPAPTAAEVAAKRDAAVEAAIQAVPADAPLRAWVPVLEANVPAARRKVVLASLRSRAGFEAEFSALAMDADTEVASPVLRWVPDLPGPAQALVPGVQAVGRDILVRLEKGILVQASEDPGYDWAADISIRFSSWMAAVFHLREHAQGDFSAELRGILLAARKRPDSQALRADVVRVASYFLHQWTGEAPLPGDPPPK